MSNAIPSNTRGIPIWADLGSPDVTAAVQFYSQLFGWQAEDLGEQAGHYHMFRHAGRRVAAVGGLMSPNQPTAWSTYIGTDDAAGLAQRVTSNGGQVLMAPFPVMDQGTMAVFMDPAGAVFSVWQPANMQGAEKFNEPVSVTWNELQTRDLEGAKRFYPQVFGWGIHTNQIPGGGEYIEWQVDGQTKAGGTTMAPGTPAQVPPHWLVYFSVVNTDDIVRRAQELGGQAIAPAMDIPQGRMAVLTDPQGAAFAVIAAPSA